MGPVVWRGGLFFVPRDIESMYLPENKVEGQTDIVQVCRDDASCQFESVDNFENPELHSQDVPSVY